MVTIASSRRRAARAAAARFARVLGGDEIEAVDPLPTPASERAIIMAISEDRTLFSAEKPKPPAAASSSTTS
jgi:hypothetical protein